MIKTFSVVDSFGTAEDFFTDIFEKKYELKKIDCNNLPDLLIFGDENFGERNKELDSFEYRIFYTGENRRPENYEADFGLTFDHINSPFHYRLPLYVLEYYKFQKMGVYEQGWRDILNPKQSVDLEKIWAEKTKFFSYVQSNRNCQFRSLFVEEMMKETEVVSGGPHLNNIGRVIPREPWDEKPKFIKESFFNIAFENGAYPGYCTEKIFDAFFSWTIPLYWGSETVSQDFNPAGYVNLLDFKQGNGIDLTEVVKYCDNLRSNKNRYCDMLSVNVAENNSMLDLDNFYRWFETFILKG